MPRFKMKDGVRIQYTAEEEVQADKDVIDDKTERDRWISTLSTKETNAKKGNDKLLGLGLTQDEVTAMTGYKPPEE